MENESTFEGGWVLKLNDTKGRFFAEKGEKRMTLNTEKTNDETRIALFIMLGETIMVQPKTGNFLLAAPLVKN